MNIFFNKIYNYFLSSQDRIFSFKDLKKKNEIKKLFSIIKKNSFHSEIKYVGGCVRKILNNEEVDDIDFAVNLNPEMLKKIFHKNNVHFIETGIKHGTITAIMNKYKFEITSLRKDLTSDGRHAEVQFTKDWEEDSLRRDFTINSIYSDINGKLYDPHNGKQDIESGNIKFIGDAENRIKEDYLRILRYVRFFLNYIKNDHYNLIKTIIKKNISGVTRISSERLLDEFKKIVNSRNFLNLFKDEFCLEIIQLIFPQFKNINIFKNNNYIRINDLDFVMILSLLLVDNTDNVNYFLYKYNLSNKQKKRILFIHKIFSTMSDKNFFSEKNLWKLYYQYGKENLYYLLYFKISNLKKENKKLNELLIFFKKKKIPIFPISAKYLMSKYKIKEGKNLGIIIKKIEEKWINNEFKISDNEIFKIIRN